MLERGKLDRGVVEIVDTESLVPAEHLLRKIDAAVDFNRVYEMVEALYSEDNGRPSVDPVVLFKMVVYCDQQAHVEDVKDCDTFIRGFRLGARMILDVVGDYDSPMVQINEMDMAE